MVSVLEWPAVNPNCEKSGSGKDAQVSLQAFPKEVYKWYKSASLHTGKKKIPIKLWLAVACALAVPLLGWFALSKLPGKNAPKPEAAAVAKDSKSGQLAPSITAPASMSTRPQLSAGEWLDARKPRLPDFPNTAPAYDDVTKPVHAPYPAACVLMAKTCKCYTQQATLLQVSGDVCLQIVRQGYFVDWQQPQAQPARPVLVRDAQEPQPARQQPAQPAVHVHLPPTPQQPQPSLFEQGLAARNAQVRSSLDR